MSGILRAAVFLLMFPLVKEVRKETVPIHRNPLLYLKEVQPIHDVLSLRSTPLAGISIFKKKDSLKEEAMINKENLPNKENNS